MSELADYLDLIEPRRFAPAAPSTAHRPTKYATTGFAASSGSATFRAATPSSRFVLPRPVPGVAIPSADPAADAARASCIEFCQNPANARECIPAAAGGSGMCSWAIPAAGSGGGMTIGPAPGGTAPSGGTSAGGSGGTVAEPSTIKKALPWALALFVAWRFLR